MEAQEKITSAPTAIDGAPPNSGGDQPCPSNTEQTGINPDRFYCPYPGCNRSFAELWRLKVHYRAPPDIRGSGRERGHGTELTHCPKCAKALKAGKHHVGCSGVKAAARQGSKRKAEEEDTSDAQKFARYSKEKAQPYSWPGTPVVPEGTTTSVGTAATSAIPATVQAPLPMLFQETNGAMSWPQESTLPLQPQPLPVDAAIAVSAPLTAPVAHLQQAIGVAGLGGSHAGARAAAAVPTAAVPTAAVPAAAVPAAAQEAAPAHYHALMPQPALDPATQQPSQPPSPGPASSEPEFLAGIFDDLPEFNRIVPSPPPLPMDFHMGCATPGRMLFNFNQFNQKMPPSLAPGAHKGLTETEVLDLAEQHVVYDQSDDGDLMQMLFGMADEVPTMATIHLHKWHNQEGDGEFSEDPHLLMGGMSRRESVSTAAHLQQPQLLHPQQHHPRQQHYQQHQQHLHLQMQMQQAQPALQAPLQQALPGQRHLQQSQPSQSLLQGQPMLQTQMHLQLQPPLPAQMQMQHAQLSQYMPQQHTQLPAGYDQGAFPASDSHTFVGLASSHHHRQVDHQQHQHQWQQPQLQQLYHHPQPQLQPPAYGAAQASLLSQGGPHLGWGSMQYGQNGQLSQVKQEVGAVEGGGGHLPADSCALGGGR